MPGIVSEDPQGAVSFSRRFKPFEILLKNWSYAWYSWHTNRYFFLFLWRTLPPLGRFSSLRLCRSEGLIRYGRYPRYPVGLVNSRVLIDCVQEEKGGQSKQLRLPLWITSQHFCLLVYFVIRLKVLFLVIFPSKPGVRSQLWLIGLMLEWHKGPMSSDVLRWDCQASRCIPQAWKM